MSTKPFTTYPGGKEASGAYQTIINEIPPHRVYREMFLGGGAIYRYKQLAEETVLVEADGKIYEQWVAHFHSMATHGRSTPVAHYGKKAVATGDNGINSVAVHNGKNTDKITTAEKALPPGHTLLNADAIKLLQTYRYVPEINNPSNYIYLDPPYPAVSKRNGLLDLYTLSLSEDQHIQLLQAILPLTANIAISTYPCDLYRDMLKDWRLIEFQSMTRQGLSTEWLFCNYDKPTALHDYRYLGSDYREREDLARQFKRNMDKFERLPVLQRNRIIKELTNKYPQI